MNFNELVANYKNSVAYESLETNSKRSYDNVLKISSSIAPDCEINSSPIDESKAWYESISTREASGSTKNRYIIILKKVYSFGVQYGLTNGNPLAHIPAFQSNQPSKEAYSWEEIELIWKAAETDWEKRNANLLRTLFWTGCRPNEIINLKWCDVGQEFISIRSAKRREKGSVSRKCNIIPQLAECLEYAKNDCPPKNPESNVFVGITAPQIHIDSLRREIKSLSIKAGVKEKQLRHTRSGLATEMLKAGYSLLDVKCTLGHKSIQTTERYCRESMEDEGKRFKGF